METIKEFLDSDIYLDIIKELGGDNFNQNLQSVEIEELKNRLRQRQFLLEGFNCKVLSEKRDGAVLRANDRRIWKRYYRLV